MTVYARTAEGQQAAYSPQSALPRKLKAILRVIDGQTPLDVYVQSLQSFGDVEGIFQSLHSAALITPMPEGAKSSRATTNLAEAELSRLVEPIGAGAWQETRSPFVMHSQPSSQLTGTFGASSLPPSATSQQFAQEKTEALQSALDLMGSFVLTHLPDQSFELLRQIEGITSLELLAVTLSGYEQMVLPLGDAGAQHISAIKQLLRGSL
jgi:hypothetical protein